MTRTALKTYWHFVADNRRLGYDDGRLVKVGKTYKVDGEPVLCGHGLHASKRLIVALRHAPGAVLCKVTLGGTVIHGDAEVDVATERTVVAMADVTDILRTFARTEAARVWFKHFKRGQYPAVDLWLDKGEEKDRSAAWSAAESASFAAESAWFAARSAAESASFAARSAAESAWFAARSAESAAESASSAARSAMDATRDAQDRRLLAMVRKANWRTA